MKGASFFHFCLSGNPDLLRLEKKKMFPQILKSSETYLKWSPIGAESTECGDTTEVFNSFKEDTLSCMTLQERKTAVADFSMAFPALFLLWNWLYPIFGEKGAVQKRSGFGFKKKQPRSSALVWLKTLISPKSHVTRCQVQKALIICTLSPWEAIFKAERRRVLPSRDKWHIVNSVRHSDTVIMSSIEMPINNARSCPDTTAYLGK